MSSWLRTTSRSHRGETAGHDPDGHVRSAEASRLVHQLAIGLEREREASCQAPRPAGRGAYYPAPGRHEIFIADSHRTPLTALMQGVLNRDPFITIIGVAGVGKTALVNGAFFAQASTRSRLIHVCTRRGGTLSLSEVMAQIIGKDGEDKLTNQDADHVFEKLTAADGDHTRVILIVDDAHALTADALEYLLGISDLARSQGIPLQLIFVARPPFVEILQRGDATGRIQISASVEPLSGAETQAYIRRYLSLAGIAAKPGLSDAALLWIVKNSGGIPGQVNELLERDLNVGPELRRNRLTAQAAANAATRLYHPAGLELAVADERGAALPPNMAPQERSETVLARARQTADRTRRRGAGTSRGAFLAIAGEVILITGFLAYRRLSPPLAPPPVVAVSSGPLYMTAQNKTAQGAMPQDATAQAATQPSGPPTAIAPPASGGGAPVGAVSAEPAAQYSVTQPAAAGQVGVAGTAAVSRPAGAVSVPASTQAASLVDRKPAIEFGEPWASANAEWSVMRSDMSRARVNVSAAAQALSHAARDPAAKLGEIWTSANTGWTVARSDVLREMLDVYAATRDVYAATQAVSLAVRDRAIKLAKLWTSANAGWITVRSSLSRAMPNVPATAQALSLAARDPTAKLGEIWTSANTGWTLANAKWTTARSAMSRAVLDAALRLRPGSLQTPELTIAHASEVEPPAQSGSSTNTVVDPAIANSGAGRRPVLRSTTEVMRAFDAEAVSAVSDRQAPVVSSGSLPALAAQIPSTAPPPVIHPEPEALAFSAPMLDRTVSDTPQFSPKANSHADSGLGSAKASQPVQPLTAPPPSPSAESPEKVATSEAKRTIAVSDAGSVLPSLAPQLPPQLQALGEGRPPARSGSVVATASPTGVRTQTQAPISPAGNQSVAALGTTAAPSAPSPAAAATPKPSNELPANRAGAAAYVTRHPDTVAKVASRELVTSFIKSGDAMLVIGNVPAARPFYERAAAANSAAAATRMGKTYDRAFLVAIGAGGMKGDPSAAAAWYRRAMALGDTEARDRLNSLGVRASE